MFRTENTIKRRYGALRTTSVKPPEMQAWKQRWKLEQSTKNTYWFAQDTLCNIKNSNQRTPVYITMVDFHYPSKTNIKTTNNRGKM